MQHGPPPAPDRHAIPRRHAVAGGLAFLGAMSRAARADTEPLRIGVLTDVSGPYSMNSGMGSVEAVRMASELFGGTVDGRRIEVLFADHQNKPDLGAGIARKWFDVDGVDAIVDLVNSSVALATLGLARSRNRVTLITGSASTEITKGSCSPTSAQWTFDTFQLANAMATANISRGGRTWFFITPDYTFGLSAEKEISARVAALGGTIVGTVHYPLGATDYSAFLAQAVAAKPQVLAFANSGPDLINAVKQAGEFGIVRNGIMLSATFTELEVGAIGLELAQGAYTASPWTVNRSPDAAEWARRFMARTGKMPVFSQAALFSAVRHYLQAVQDTGTKEATAVMARMRATPVNDPFTSNATLREDGLLVHDWYLSQVKTPAESMGPNDYFKLISALPGDTIACPLAAGTCPLVKH